MAPKNALARWLDQRSAPQLVVLCLLLLAVLGTVDWWTGWEASFSVFYVVPVVIAAWHGNRLPACLVSVVGALVWLGSNTLAGEVHSVGVTLWNTGTRLASFLIVAVLVADQRILLDRERRLASLDALTGIDNLRSYMAKAARVLGEAAEAGRTVSTVYIDVDDFKRVNDEHGHPAGDELLRELAAILRSGVRATDTVARLGGDEFALLLPDTDEAEAVAMAERLGERLAEVARKRRWPVSLSIGVLVQRAPLPDVEATLRLADQLMYQAKREGKDRVQVRVEG